MKTFAFTVELTGKITVPDTLLRDLRNEASNDPKTEGGDKFLNELHKATYENDDAFLQGAIKNALRNIARNGIVQDIGGMGVGIKAAPATVTVSVPERVVTRIQSGKQIGVERIDVQVDAGTSLAQQYFDEISAQAVKELASELPANVLDPDDLGDNTPIDLPVATYGKNGATWPEEATG